jgi:hypothetical protein
LDKLREIMKRPEVLAALSESHKGKTPPNKGVKAGPYSPAQKEAHDAAMARPEVRAKMSVAHMGKSVPRTPEWNANIGAALKGRVISPEHRQKLVAAWARRKARSA